MTQQNLTKKKLYSAKLDLAKLDSTKLDSAKLDSAKLFLVTNTELTKLLSRRLSSTCKTKMTIASSHMFLLKGFGSAIMKDFAPNQLP